MVFDLNGTILKPSISFCYTTGYTVEELCDHPLMDFVLSEDRISSILGFGSLLQGNQLSNFENRIQCKTGSIEWFSWIGIPFLNEEKIIAIFQVITNQKTIEKDLLDQEKKYKSIYDNLPIGIAVTDENGIILEVNELAIELFEIEKTTKLKRSLNHKKWPIITTKGSSILPRTFTLLQALKKKESLKGLEFGLVKNSGILWLELMATPLPIDGYGLTIAVRDITERKNAEARISYLAYYDEVTSLPRKKFFIEKVSIMLEEALRHNKKVGILSLDIDNFKYLNESYGHNFGDNFLKSVAEILTSSIRNYDIIAREGGDEFLIALPDLENEAEAAVLCEMINSYLVNPVQVDNHTVFTSMSIGIAIFPNDGKEPESLIKNADNALHLAKTKGKNTFRFLYSFTSSIRYESVRD